MPGSKRDVSRIELVRAFRERYRLATRKNKRTILNELISLTDYHPKAAIRALNAEPRAPAGNRRRRALYDEAAKQALIVLWEASDRLCGKRLVAMLPQLVGSLERHGHLRLDEPIRAQILKMRSATIDRLLREPRRANKTRKPRRVETAVRRRVKVRTFADWNEPPPGSMEMDLVAHCGEVNRGSYINSLVLTDIASGWTECAPLVVRESGLLIETVERIRTRLPFTLCALDVDNGCEFVNEAMIQYCLRRGIEFTRSRPYRKNDQAWIEQKNGAVVRRHIGYARFEGIATADVFGRFYNVARLFGNIFQPSFKLAEKHREGARVSKRYHAPQTPCERLLQSEMIPETTKKTLREVRDSLDPLKLLEEMRAIQLHLVALTKGEDTNVPPAQAPDLTEFLASLSGAWRAGEIRPTHGAVTKQEYWRRIEPRVESPAVVRPILSPLRPTVVPIKAKPSPPPDRPLWAGLDLELRRKSKLQQQEFARRRIRRQHAFTLVWPLACRRLEGRPNMNATELFDELCTQYPGRFHHGQLKAFTDRVVQWRKDARARGVVIGRLSYRSTKPRGRRRPDPLKAYWPDMLECLEADPDQTSLELLAKLIAKHPDAQLAKHLRTLQRRVKLWRQAAIERLISQMQEDTLNLNPLQASLAS
jgi:hypothetical protein